MTVAGASPSADSAADELIANDDASSNPPGRSLESRFLVPILAVLSVLLLGWRLLYQLLTTGGNTPTGDDIWPIRLFLHPAATGQFNWGSLLDVAYNNGQQQAFSFLVYHASAVVTNLDYYSFAWYAVLLGAVRVFLIYDLAIRASGRAPGRLILLPALAFLTFSYTQFALYEFDVTAVPFGTGLTMLVVGIWAAVRFPGRWAGALIAAGAITVGCLAGGIGPVSIPFILASLAVFGMRRWTQWLTVITVVAANVGLYVWLYVRATGAALQDRASDIYDLSLVADLAGLAWAPPGNPALRTAGVVTLVVTVVFVAFVPFAVGRRWIDLRAALPAVVFIGFGVASVLQLFLVRGFAVQYYAYASMFLWIGIALAAYALLAPVLCGDRSLRTITGVSASLGAAFVGGAIVAFGIPANATAEDDMLFSRWRTVVSESCVRHYRAAPTTCEIDLVPWAAARLPEFLKSLGEPLEEAELGPFAPQQRWWLQGDFILNNVAVSEIDGDVYWTRARRAAPETFRSPIRMNLFLQARDRVEWTVDLPKGSTAVLRTAASGPTSTIQQAEDADGLDATIWINGDERASAPIRAREVRWRPLEVDLAAYAGSTITIEFGADPRSTTSTDEFLFKAPHIDIEIPNPSSYLNDEKPFYPAPKPDDLHLPVSDPLHWSLDEIDVLEAGDSTLWEARPGTNPRMTLQAPLDECLADYSSVAFQLAVDEPWQADPHDLVYEHHALKVYYRLSDQPVFNEHHSFLVPFYFDSFDGREGTTADEVFGSRPGSGGALPMRSYTFPLRALELPRNARLVEIAIAPYQRSMRGVRNRFRFEEFRFVRRDGAESRACEKSEQPA